MKAILEFNLDDPDDAQAHRRCVNATNVYLAILDIGEALGKLSHSSQLKGKTLQLIETLIEEVNNILAEYRVDTNGDIS